MNGMGYPARMHEALRGDDRRRASEWRRLHRRPDAEPDAPRPDTGASDSRWSGLRWFRRSPGSVRP